MSTFLYDTFDGAAGDLLDHVGDTGATWTRHPAFPDSPGNATTWQLSGTGTAYSPVSNYVDTMYLASGVPVDPLSYDIHMTFKVIDFGYSVLYGIVFDCDDTTDDYHLLHFSANEKRWELSRHYPGGGYPLGNSPQAYDPPVDIDRELRVERRVNGSNTRINVYLDGELLITGDDDPNSTGSRVGLASFGIGNATASTGFHVRALGAGSAAFEMPVPPEEPIYEVSGPADGAPDFDSAAFTVGLITGANPGSITITPAVAGVTGTFTPTSVTLADADRTKTFLFHPTTEGTATLSFTNGSGLVDVTDLSYNAAYLPPSREAFWASNLATDPTVSGPYVSGDFPYPDGGGYYLEGDDHYDPIECWYKVQEYATRKGLTPSDYSAQIAAAVVRFRDRGVLALNDQYRLEHGGASVQGHHRTIWGVARHYYHTSDPVDVTAADVLLPYAAAVDEAGEREFGEGVGPQREMAFLLASMVDRAHMGLGEDARLNVYCDIILGHVGMWTEPRATRKYGTYLKPWMGGGISARALIMYWERYRGSADATRAALAARIPDALKALADYIYSDESWLPGEGSSGHGCIKYRDLDPTDPLFEPILDLQVTAVGANPRRVFRGPASLSTQDDHYLYGIILIGGTGGVENIGGIEGTIAGYDGATREFTINATYPLTFDVTTSMTFGIKAHFWEDIGSGAAPALNPMVFPLFAWCYWHERRVVGDFAASKRFRIMAHDCFDGSSQMWATAYSRKEWNQSTFWTTDGLTWLERGDEEWDAATTYTLAAPTTGAAGDAAVESGVFRLSVPYGTRVSSPAVVTPACDTGLGTFTTPSPVLSDDRRMAMFAFTPNVADDGTSVDVSATSPGLTAPAAVAYAVGDVPDPGTGAGNILMYTRPGGRVLLLSRPGT